MARFKPGDRVQYSNGVIYRVGPDGSHHREDGGKMSKAERKAAKKARGASRRRESGAVQEGR